MVTANGGRGTGKLLSFAVGLIATLAGWAVFATPAHAANVQLDWVNATTVKFGGSAVRTPVDVAGSFVGNVSGTPPGSQTFMAVSNGPIDMSFGCKVSMTLDIYPDANGKLDYSKGEIVFTTGAPSTCSQATLKANIPGLVPTPNGGTANLSLINAPIGGVNNRGPGGGNDSTATQIVNVTAGMGPASNNTGIPNTDTFVLCEAKGGYATNIDQLTADCLAQKAGAVSKPAMTSNALSTLKDGKGPNGGDEKGWTGQFKGVKAGNYVACSLNFKACSFFTKDAGTVANIYVSFGSTPGSTIPGNLPGQGATDQKVCTTGDGLAGGLAWILCPVVQVIADATNFFENNIIVPFMTISPLTTNASNPIYILWQNIRNLANVGFILLFLIVVFSQATSIGISNYGIKRILPKMVAVVVGVNLSYFGVAVIIDAFNIFGAGISQLVTAALQQAGTTQLNTGTSAGAVRSIFTLGGAALGTILLTGGAAIGWFFSFLGLALLVVVVVVIVLVIRQMAIIALVIVSPVAILLYMLPNTEGYFNKWRKMLVQLLMMYPMIVLLFAAGKIFGVILQQPDFKLAGEGVSDDVAQAVRVILQFVVYVVPLVFLPATFAASGALMGRAYGWLHSRAVQPRSQRLREDAGQLAREAQLRAASGYRIGGRQVKIPGVSQAAGMGLRRNYVREQRRRNLQREQEEYVAGALETSSMMRRGAAGVSGAAGETRAAAYAANVASKGRSEDLDNEMALLEAEMRRLGVDQKTFASKAADYLSADTPAKKAEARTFTGANGQSFDFQANETRLQRALLNSAASQGEIKAIEAARLNGDVDQTMVDDIIRRNDGKLKEKGGYHLATNFNLAANRMTQISRNASGEMLKADGSVTTDIKEAARVAITDPKLMETRMKAERLIAMAQSGANSVAGMKAGILGDTAKVLTNAKSDPTLDAALRQQFDDLAALQDMTGDQLRSRLNKTMDDIAKNPNTMARTEASKETIENIGNNIL